jgi:hypothetical protein
MEREPVVGECVVVARNIGEHGARVGSRFVVCRVDDSDNTLKGIPAGSSTVADYWMPWSDVEAVPFGWDFARTHLPADVVALLAACDGIQTISLNRQIKNAIFESLPDWRQRVMEALETMDLEGI